jgi:hypothetical protein
MDDLSSIVAGSREDGGSLPLVRVSSYPFVVLFFAFFAPFCGYPPAIQNEPATPRKRQLFRSPPGRDQPAHQAVVLFCCRRPVRLCLLLHLKACRGSVPAHRPRWFSRVSANSGYQMVEKNWFIRVLGATCRYPRFPHCLTLFVRRTLVLASPVPTGFPPVPRSYSRAPGANHRFRPEKLRIN